MKKLIIMVGFLMMGLCLYAQNEEDAEKQAEDTVYIPKDLQDCLLQLDILLSSGLRDTIRQMEEEEFNTAAHFGLGMWLRNRWRLWGNTRLNKYFNGLGLFHPDDISHLILQSYHRYLNGRPLDIEPYIKKCKAYWAEVMARDKKRQQDEKRMEKKSQKWAEKLGLTPPTNWEETYQFLHLPILDSETGACTKVRTIGDSLGAEEIQYLQRNTTTNEVFDKRNNDCYIIQSYEYELSQNGLIRNVSGWRLRNKMGRWTFEAQYDKAGRITNIIKVNTVDNEISKELHFYNSAGYREKVEVYRNDSLEEKHTFTYLNQSTYRENVFGYNRRKNPVSTYEYQHDVTLDARGNIIQDHYVSGSPQNNVDDFDIKLIQYDGKGRRIHYLWYKDSSLVGFTTFVYDDESGTEYSFSDDDVKYNSTGWCDFNDKRGNSLYNIYMARMTEWPDYKEWYRYDSHGNIIRVFSKSRKGQEQKRKILVSARIRYW